MAVSVQFKSKEATIQAFQNVEVEAWSVWQHKQLLFKGIGDQDLNAFLDMLCENSTNAIYTIKWYEDIHDKKAIKDNTPCDGSFNFKLNADTQEINQSQYGVIKHNNELASRVGAMESKFDLILEKLEGESEEEEQPNRLGIIGDIIGHPAIAPMIPTFIAMLTGTQYPAGNYKGHLQPMQNYQATVGNIPNETKLNDAIERLKLYDDKLADHLLKLAIIAETDRNTFAMVMQTLEAYKPPQ